MDACPACGSADLRTRPDESVRCHACGCDVACPPLDLAFAAIVDLATWMMRRAQVTREESGVFSAVLPGWPVYAQGATEASARDALDELLIDYLRTRHAAEQPKAV